MVGHIVHLATYLSTSRHGIYYFRFPLPVDRHPARKRGQIKISLATRAPKDAKQLSRLLAVAGQRVLAGSLIRSMRYDEMREHVREHFTHLLREFHEQSAADGSADGVRLDALRASHGLAEGDPADWADLAHAEGSDGLVTAFCEMRRISPEPEGQKRTLLIAELQKGYREYVTHALKHSTDFDTQKITS